MTNTDSPSRTPAQKLALALALVVALAAVAIEIMVALGRLSDSWASIGGGFVILALAISVIGRSLGRTSASTKPPA